MNKKQFIRGFGTGVLFYSIVLGISFTVRTSDSYIKSMAKELGMVYAKEDSGALDFVKAEETPVPSVEATEKPENKATTSPKSTEKPKKVIKKTDASQKDLDDAKKNLDEKKDSMDKEIDNQLSLSKKKLTISVGEWSDSVCKKLQSMGIVDNAKDFDKYLNDNGYSSYISAGTYTVSPDDTYSELAKKITKR